MHLFYIQIHTKIYKSSKLSMQQWHCIRPSMPGLCGTVSFPHLTIDRQCRILGRLNKYTVGPCEKFKDCTVIDGRIQATSVNSLSKTNLG